MIEFIALLIFIGFVSVIILKYLDPEGFDELCGNKKQALKDSFDSLEKSIVEMKEERDRLKLKYNELKDTEKTRQNEFNLLKSQHEKVVNELEEAKSELVRLKPECHLGRIQLAMELLSDTNELMMDEQDWEKYIFEKDKNNV